MPDGAARRGRSDRLPTVFPVDVELADGRRTHGVAVNLSPAGLRVHLNEAIEPGEVVVLELWRADAHVPIRLDGEVRWVDELSPILRPTFAYEAGVGLDTIPAEFGKLLEEETDRFVDNRDDPRLQHRMRVRIAGPGVWETTFAPNLSRRGIFVRTDAPLEPGQLVEVTLFLPDGEPPLAVRGEVVHAVDPGHAEATGTEAGLGIRLVVSSPASRARVQRYLDGLDESRD